MKKIIVIIFLSLFQMVAHANPNLPFIGYREFNFLGGNGTEMFIRIKPNGNTTIVMCGSAASGSLCGTVYKGSYERSGYKIIGEKIYDTDPSCREYDACESDLYDVEPSVIKYVFKHR